MSKRLIIKKKDEKCSDCGLLNYFVIFWIEYPVLIYVNNKFCNRNLVSVLFQCSVNISQTFYCLYKFNRGSRIGRNT